MPYQDVNINFQQGLDLKTDPWQISIGKFLSLMNCKFQKGGLLSKRDGYAYVTGAPTNSKFLATLNENLIAVGNTISADCQSLERFITKGTLQPCSLNVLPLIRNNLNQVQTDSVTSNDLTCVVYTQQTANSTGLVTNYLFAIQDATTGQNISTPSAIAPLSNGTISGSSRVVVVGNYFVIVSPCLISGTTFLQYIAIPIIFTGPVLVSPFNVFVEAYVPLSGNPGWDMAVGSDQTLVVAYNTTAGGQAIHVTSLTAGQIAAGDSSGIVHSFTNAAYKAGILSICVDLTVSPNIFYISFWNPTTTNGYTCAIYTSFGAITAQFTPQQIITSLTIENLASCAKNGVATVYSEVQNTYSFASTVSSNFIDAVTVSSSGTVGSPYVVVRSVGLASKAFIVNGTQYFLSAFQSTFQPSYFLINGSTSTSASPVIVAKLAYQNGGGYLALGLPGVTIAGTTASLSYLYKQDVEALNTLNNTQQTTAGGIYSQLGINSVSIEIGTATIQSAEIGNDLHLSGGFLGMFDGFYPVEHNFFVFPEPIACTFTENSVKTPTGTFALGAFTVVLSSATGVFPGMSITDTANAYIPTGTVIVYVNGTTVTISQATTHAATSDSLSIQGNIASEPDGATHTNAYYYQVTYEWTDMKGNPFRSQPSIPVAVTTTGTTTTGIITINVPTLRLTQKIATPVKIVIYRWSVETEVYNEVTSVNAPILNSTTTDSITFVDTLSDLNVVGNNILYTTGGVVPDTNGPACNLMTLFDTRLFQVAAEDPNVLWASKTVVEGVPVEMSSEFTIYIAPNVGTTASTGPMRSLAPMDDKLILFKKNSIFYMNGTGPDNLGSTAIGCPLGNYSPPIFVTSVVGCVNQNSIVLTQDGLMFQSDKGIWLLNRQLGTSYIGAPVEDFNSYQVTSANVIPETNFVVFTLNTNTMLMYDYYYGQWATWQGNGPILSSCIYNGLHTILTSNGQILQQTPGQYLDGTQPVLMSFKTGWLNLASLQGYERFYEFQFLAKYLSPHLLEVNVSYDYNDSVYHSSTINPMNFSPTTPGPFGIQTPFGAMVSLEQWRIHAKQQLCQSFQVGIQEVFNPAYGTLAGAGLTMSGINCEVEIKKGRRPIRGANAVG